MNESDGNHGLETAVLFLVFNRPDTTRTVFEAIRQIKPARLYVAADGPRPNKLGEDGVTALVRNLATDIDWPCELKTLFRDENLGCKMAVSSAIDWFFEHEEQGIILEDDCLPHPDFFVFCESLLQKYAKDDRVWVITGNNFQDGQKRGDAAYYFSRYNHVWGWASWRRAWEKRDMELAFWPSWKNSDGFKNVLVDKIERKSWSKTFDKVYTNKITTAWDYPWTASVWFHGGLTATPNVNLVSNIGFGELATHTTSALNINANLPVQSFGELTHPSAIEFDVHADRYVFDRNFGGNDQRFPRNVIIFPKRVVNFVLRKFGFYLAKSS